MLALAALTMPMASCTSDLDQYLYTETTSQQVLCRRYESVLGKIYTSMVTTGQGKGD